MSSMNAQTGKLFGDTAQGKHDDLRQSVMDRILTPLGSQPWRPLYGSAAYRTGIVGVQAAANSINNALRTGPWRDPRIRRVKYLRRGAGIEVTVVGDWATVSTLL